MRNTFIRALSVVVTSGLLGLIGTPVTTQAQTYCTPQNTSSSSTNGINTVKSVNGTINFQNANSGFSTNGYGDFTTDTVQAMQGATFKIQGSAIGNSSNNWGLWIDWNQDGDFSDAGEQVFLNNNGVGNFTVDITVPYAAIAGATRLRVLTSSYDDVDDACMSSSSLEAEDYTLDIVAAPTCTGQPDAGVIVGSATINICPGLPFSLTDTGATGAGNMIYQWQQRPSGGNWSDIPGAIGFTLAAQTGISASTDYRFYVVCNGSNLSDTSNVINVVLNSSNDCYCIPDLYDPSDYTSVFINTIQTNGGLLNINNSNNGQAGYQDFRNTDTLNVMAGQQISLTAGLTASSTYTSAVLAGWIDWNHDGDFDDPGEMVIDIPYQQCTQPFTSSFAVPLAAQVGHTTMRLMVFPANSTLNPCGTGLSTFSSGEAEDYTVIVDSLPSCANATFPSSVGAMISTDSLCESGSVTLDVDSTLYFNGITYQWQKSTDGGTSWTNVDTPQMLPSKTVSGVDSNTQFKCEILCSGSLSLTSSTVDVYVIHPELDSLPANVNRCGPGAVTLTAQPSAGNTVNWYADAFGGAPLSMNTNTLSVNYIPQTTVYYAAASGGTVSHSDLVDNENDPLQYASSGNPLALSSGAAKQQILLTAARLNAAGFTKAGYISSLALQVLDSGSVDTLHFSIGIGQTDDVDLSSGWHTVTEVYNNQNYTPTANTMNTYDFNQSFYWDGTSNIVLQFCVSADITATPSTDWKVKGTDDYLVTWPDFRLYHTDYGNFTPICNDSDFYSTSSQCPNIFLEIHELCEGPRVPDTAFVTPGQPFEITYDSVVCNGAISDVSVSTPLNNYANGYVWTALDTSVTLYEDQAGTQVYTGGNAATVYFKSMISGFHRIAVMASAGNSPSDCAAADTAIFWVQPGDIQILSMPDTICGGMPNATAEMMLYPNSGYAQGPFIQWQESASGQNYNNIPGTNQTSLSSAALTTNHYYKAIISAVSGICETPSKLIVVANPTILSIMDSSHCGPGSVVLHAETTGNSEAVWYDSDTASDPIAFGNTYTTSPLTQTDTFYVAARGGSASVPTDVTFGDGSSTSSYSSVSPFYHSYGGYKHQFLIKKSELNAMGIHAGFITSLAFNVIQGGYSYDDFTISMGNTTLASLTTNSFVPVQEVRAPQTVTTVDSQWNTFGFDQPFYWDGISNLVIQTCWSNNNTGGGGSTVTYDGLTFNATHAGYGDNQTANDICDGSGIVYQTTLTDRPQIQLGSFGPCESSRETVVAKIYPKPVVDLGSDINQCVDSAGAIVLDAGLQPNSPHFNWNTGSNSQVISVDQSGTYSVTVTNSFACKTADTIDVTLRHNPDVDLGPDITACEYATVTLDAGDDGIQYYWNTGATTQTTDVTRSGEYTVLVTNDEGCTKGDTVVVDMSGQAPSFDGIQITNDGNLTFHFNALNPQNVVGYEWDFGDGSPHSNAPVPSHTYLHDGNYVVTLVSSSPCGTVTDSTSAHILGVGRIEPTTKQLSVYPNPANSQVTIETKGLKMDRIQMYNVLGQKVYQREANDKTKIVLDVNNLASGVYTISIYTNEGIAVRKLNIIK